MAEKRGKQAGNALFVIIVILAIAAGIWWWLQTHPDGGVFENPSASEDQAPDEPGGAATDEEVTPPIEDEPPSEDDDAPPPAEEVSDLTDEDGMVFSYLPAGDLIPNSGPGLVDETVYRQIQFPAEDAVFLNSQVYRYGGSMGSLNGMEGGHCNARNYEYPWQDTFCEHRDRNQPLCPGGGHEGLDMRPHSCTKDKYWAVAVEDGRIIDVRRHWVTLQTSDGAIYNYLHLNMADLSVAEGDNVRQGDRIGKISNDFFKSDGTRVSTTTHLHFEMYENYAAEPGDDPLFTKVNPYMTLVDAYDRKLRGH